MPDKAMQAKDVMTEDVVSAGPDSTVAEVAEILLAHGISAVPVIEGEELVGIVSEGDLIRRAEIGTAAGRPRSWWLRLFNDSAELAADYVKTHAARIRDVMTEDVITVAEDAALADVAAALEKNRIKRVPVMRRGRVVGIVSRADLIRRLAAARTSPLAAVSADDGAIRVKIVDALRSEPWSNVESADVTVTDGLVEFWGIYRSEAARHAARVLAENVPGVRGVEDHRVELTSVPYGYV